jgi:hypothetical protein
MKRLLIPAFLGLLTLGASAQTESDSEVRVHGRQIEVPAQPYRMWQTNCDDFKGGYDLSNGEAMTLFSRGLRMYAVIGDRPMTEILAARRNEFVAANAQFKMTLAQGQGEVTGEVLLKVPANTAQASADGVETVRLTASR